MPIAIQAAHGWERNLLLSNPAVELLITLDVGPRILSYRHHGGDSPLQIVPEQAGGRGEPDWMLRGGHRLWLAPESRAFTYVPDNAPVQQEIIGERAVRLTPPPESGIGIQKQMEVHLAASGSGVRLVHRVTNIGAAPVRLAPWAITVMQGGGVCIVPQPRPGQHPVNLLPNRRVILWPYADPTDGRWRQGRRYLTLQQDPAAAAPFKYGLGHAVDYAAYLWRDCLFVKRFACDPAATYPDLGSAFEAFTNARILEVETLGPLLDLAPGASVTHSESWELFAGVRLTDSASDDAIDAALGPLLSPPPDAS